MENRRQFLAISFSDLVTYEGREEYVKSLISLDEDRRLDVLYDQYHINPDNLHALLSYLQNRKGKDSGLSKEISQILQTPMIMNTGYATLKTPSLKDQYIRGLLALSSYSRNQRLEVQFSVNPANLLTLADDLLLFRQKFNGYPNYLSALNDIMILQELHSSKDLTEKESQDSADESIHVASKTDKQSIETVPETENAVCINGEIGMPATMAKNFDALFNCPIGFYAITSPVITPQGTTYQHAEIREWINQKHSDPIDRSLLNESLLTSNKLFSDIRNLLFETDTKLKTRLDLQQLQKLLTCPLSGELLTDPVIAADGITYNRLFIQSYLASHNNMTPARIKQTRPLYTHRFILNLYELVHIDQLIETHLISENEKLARQQHETLMAPMREYINTRARKSNFTGSSFGYCAWDKVIAHTHAIQALSGKMSIHTFFSQHQRDLKVLNQGTSKTVARPALEYLESLRIRNS